MEIKKKLRKKRKIKILINRTYKLNFRKKNSIITFISKIKLKVMFIFLAIIIIIIFNNVSYSSDNNKNCSNYSYFNPYFEIEKDRYEFFLSFKEMPSNLNDPEIEKERRQILEYIWNKTRNNITLIDAISFNIGLQFGNALVAFNKAIFYAEMLGAKKIILTSNNNLYIKNNLYDKEYNLTIEISTGNNYQRNIYSISNLIPNLYYKFFHLRIPNKFYIFKDEILRNLPKVEIDPNSLFIYFRTGGTFKYPNGSPSYIPFPLCFYEKIIKENNFKKITIIAQDKQNPIIDYLLNKYSFTKYESNSLEKDISYLANAYNIVGAVSSFIIGIIKLNNNLKKYWEYDIYQVAHKILHLHPLLFNYSRNFTIFCMEPSTQYKMKMHDWAKSDDQLKIMFNDTCPFDFKIF